MYNSTCNLCGKPSYKGLQQEECSNPSCKNYIPAGPVKATSCIILNSDLDKIKRNLLTLVPSFANYASPAFQNNGWTWAIASGLGIPTRQDIIDHLNWRIATLSLSGENELYCSSGRIAIRVRKYEDDTFYASITLEVHEEEVEF
jgi:hypothetical protein